MKKKTINWGNSLEWQFSIIVIAIGIFLFCFIGFCSNLHGGKDISENNQQIITGNVEAMDTVSFEELSDDYLLIIRYQEKYTKHFETKRIGDKVDTVATFTWDTIGKETRVGKQVKFLGSVVDTDKLDLNAKIQQLELNDDEVTSEYKNRAFVGYLYKDNTLLDTVGDVRYRYEYIPKKIEVKLLTNANNYIIINSEEVVQ